VNRSPAGEFDYETNGAGYGLVRRADPRIAMLVLNALGSARTIVNVGAGTGSYEPKDRRVVAVEPSAAMRAQRPPGSAPVIDAVAEALPFGDQSVDAMATVTVHQWSDARRGLAELRRITRGPVVILTFDGTALDRFWLADYAPEVLAVEGRRYPPIALIADVLGGDTTISSVPIPFDCRDGFTEAFYARPEACLDPTIRRAQSAWGFVDAAAEERAVNALAGDLASGRWDARYGALRSQPEFEGSLRVVVSRPLGDGIAGSSR